MEAPKDAMLSSVPSEKNLTLIAEVKKFPSLYDNSNPSYYVLAERNAAWLQVSKNCGDPADLCHLRWKALRKRFAKERRKFHEILQGRRRPWALFPKMAFLTPTHIVPKLKKKPLPKKKSVSVAEDIKPSFSDDDMLILGENNEIVQTIKSGEMSEEDEYIYETLDDPDAALELMRSGSAHSDKPTAIRSGGPRPAPAPTRAGGSGRIRKLTPKMQNSMIAKKLKQAQQILQQQNTNTKSTLLEQRLTSGGKPRNVTTKKVKKILNQDKTTRHVATVNPNIVRVEGSELENNKTSNGKEFSSPVPQGGQPFKVVKLKGRNPLIFSPDQYPEIHSFLKSESSAFREINSPVIKVKSVDNLNNSNGSSASTNNVEGSNLDIIHSVGLVRKSSVVKVNDHQSYSRSYSWNRPEARAVKQTVKKTTCASKEPATAVKQVASAQPNPKVHNFETEETWNDIKEEIIDDDYWAAGPEDRPSYLPHEPMVVMQAPEDPQTSTSPVTQARLDLITLQRRLLEEQHLKTMEYMKREHDLKMTLLKAEIDLKRKQLNIML